jgi:hypothetical protein
MSEFLLNHVRIFKIQIGFRVSAGIRQIRTIDKDKSTEIKGGSVISAATLVGRNNSNKIMLCIVKTKKY